MNVCFQEFASFNLAVWTSFPFAKSFTSISFTAFPNHFFSTGTSVFAKFLFVIIKPSFAFPSILLSYPSILTSFTVYSISFPFSSYTGKSLNVCFQEFASFNLADWTSCPFAKSFTSISFTAFPIHFFSTGTSAFAKFLFVITKPSFAFPSILLSYPSIATSFTV